jgi:hypothetical protein
MGPLRKRSKPNPTKSSTLGAGTLEDKPSTDSDKATSAPINTEEQQQIGGASHDAGDDDSRSVEPAGATKKSRSSAAKEVNAFDLYPRRPFKLISH